MDTFEHFCSRHESYTHALIRQLAASLLSDGAVLWKVMQLIMGESTGEPGLADLKPNSSLFSMRSQGCVRVRFVLAKSTRRSWISSSKQCAPCSQIHWLHKGRRS